MRAKNVLEAAALAAEVLDPHTVRAAVTHDIYTWGQFRAVEAGFAASGINGRLGHWRNTEYSDAEWAAADFWEVTLPDSPLPSGAATWKTCENCSRRFMNSYLSLPYQKPIRYSKKLFALSEDTDVISYSGKQAIEAAGLRGLNFGAFDTGGNYFTFRAKTTLETQHFPDNEYEGDQNVCASCGHCKGYRFGPHRFRRSEWNGDDFVSLRGWPDFVCCTPRAFSVLLTLDKSIQRAGMVALE